MFCSAHADVGFVIVCGIMCKLHYYDEETKQFDGNAGSLASLCRIGLIDKGDGTYDVKGGLMPPSDGHSMAAS